MLIFKKPSALITLLFLSACLPQKQTIEEAFATLEPNLLQAYIQSIPKKSIAKHQYGRRYNVFHAAIINPRSAYAIEAAYEAGANINHQDADGRTPLHHTIDANIPNSAESLLFLGALTNIENEAGYSALRFCNYVLKSDPQHATCLIITKP